MKEHLLILSIRARLTNKRKQNDAKHHTHPMPFSIVYLSFRNDFSSSFSVVELEDWLSVLYFEREKVRTLPVTGVEE